MFHIVLLTLFISSFQWNFYKLDKKGFLTIFSAYN